MIRYLNLIGLFFILFLAGCGGLKKGLGFEKDVPDEFLIRKNNPIVRPPNYDLLPPDSKSTDTKISKKNSNSSDDLKKIFNDSIKSDAGKKTEKSSGNLSSEAEDIFLKKIIGK